MKSRQAKLIAQMRKSKGRQKNAEKSTHQHAPERFRAASVIIFFFIIISTDQWN